MPKLKDAGNFDSEYLPVVMHRGSISANRLDKYVGIYVKGKGGFFIEEDLSREDILLMHNEQNIQPVKFYDEYDEAVVLFDSYGHTLPGKDVTYNGNVYRSVPKIIGKESDFVLYKYGGQCIEVEK